MPEKVLRSDGFAWWFWVCVAGCIALALTTLTFSGSDYCAIFYVVVTVPLVIIVLLVTSSRSRGKQRFGSLLALAMFVGFTALLATHFAQMRDAARWLVVGRAYKAEVLAQPSPAPGRLRHMEWEAWGAPGAGDTLVYLVSDPSDSLAMAAKSKTSGKFGNLPCPVYRVRRLDQGWYAVHFYTDTAWEDCPN